MKKLISIIIMLGVILGVSFLKMFTITTNEREVVGSRDCFEICPPGWDTAIYGDFVKREVNFWEFIRN